MAGEAGAVDVDAIGRCAVGLVAGAFEHTAGFIGLGDRTAQCIGVQVHLGQGHLGKYGTSLTCGLDRLDGRGHVQGTFRA
ncbi:MAG: hypothetical protein BGP25_16355 [Lysobacterales bacterium 63-13]|nr:MAG: hypothetical protein BGP25_16355 [Xanthomonadales bacterium 63-13]